MVASPAGRERLCAALLRPVQLTQLQPAQEAVRRVGEGEEVSADTREHDKEQEAERGVQGVDQVIIDNRLRPSRGDP